MSFRVSEGQYHTLKSVCVKKGARSLSDFLRCGVERMIRNPSLGNEPIRDEPLAGAIAFLHRRISEIDHKLQTLSIQIQKGRPD